MPVGGAALSAGSVVGTEPWRTFRAHRGQTHYSGFYWSSTMGDHVIYESRLELARLLFADHDLSVVKIYAQPFLMQATIDGRSRRHVPDYLLVHEDDSLQVVDVKPAHQLDKPRVTETLRWAGDVIDNLGWRFEIWSEPDPVMLANLRFVAGYRRQYGVEQEVCSAIVSYVNSQHETPIRGVELALADQHPSQRVRAHVLHLLWNQRLSVDWAVPVDSAARVWVGR